MSIDLMNLLLILMVVSLFTTLILVKTVELFKANGALIKIVMIFMWLIILLVLLSTIYEILVYLDILMYLVVSVF
jgi:hypothetical protein